MVFNNKKKNFNGDVNIKYNLPFFNKNNLFIIYEKKKLNNDIYTISSEKIRHIIKKN